MEKIQLFLDYANINESAKKFGYEIDYDMLLNRQLASLDEGRVLTGAFAYVSRDPRSEFANDKIIDELWNSGFFVNSKVGQISGLTYRCNFYVEIAMDIIKIAINNKPDIIVLVSADRDFIPVIRELRTMGIRVEIASFKDEVSRDLKQISSGFIALDEYFIEAEANEVKNDEIATNDDSSDDKENIDSNLNK